MLEVPQKALLELEKILTRNYFKKKELKELHNERVVSVVKSNHQLREVISETLVEKKRSFECEAVRQQQANCLALREVLIAVKKKRKSKWNFSCSPSLLISFL